MDASPYIPMPMKALWMAGRGVCCIEEVIYMASEHQARSMLN